MIWMKKYYLGLLATVAVTIAYGQPSAQTIRLDASGNSADKLKAALAEANGLIQKGPVEILLSGGTYYLDSTLVFDEANSGTAQHALTIKAAEGEK